MGPGKKASPSPTPTTPTGPPTDCCHGNYRRLSSDTTFNGGKVYVNLPCNSGYPNSNGDNPFVYLAGWSAPYTNEYESGVAYDINGTSMNLNTWTPYIKVPGSTSYFANGGNLTIAEEQNYPNLFYTCGTNLPGTIYWFAWGDQACYFVGDPTYSRPPHDARLIVGPPAN